MIPKTFSLSKMYTMKSLLRASQRPTLLRFACAPMGTSTPDNAKTIKMRWKGKAFGEKMATAKVGQTLLEVSRANDIYLEAACEGSLACSTCHCILDTKAFSEAKPPKEAEEDLLDLAFDLRPTSRLGCQVIVTEAMDGSTVELPSATRNMAVDGYVAPAH